jgi:uncharacterized protein YcbX
MEERTPLAGKVVSLWRYPIKSMLGEEVQATPLANGCLLGDRAFALIDCQTGHVASAKHPQRWLRLFACRAAFIEPPVVGEALPPVRVTLPDGASILTGQSDFNRLVSQALGREVVLSRATLPSPHLEQFCPEMEGLTSLPGVTRQAMPPFTFFDLAPLHLLTTATLAQLAELYPLGRFDVRRFRPNFVIESTGEEKGFVENAWIGQRLSIGSQVRLQITGACPRCVMTTLPQGDLPADLGILRTAARHTQANVGVYASVRRGGTIRQGDALRVEDWGDP